MRKPFIVARTILAAGVVLLGNALAQQPPTKSQGASAKTQSKPAAKTPSPAPAKSATASPLATQKDKISYALGMNIATSLSANLKRQGVEINPDVLLRALRDGLAGAKMQMTEEEARATLMQLQQEMQAKQEAKIKEDLESNKKEGDAFLAANKTKEGVVTLPSGLQYKILTVGKGPKPAATDTVACNYRGTLINGTEFDSSYKRGEPSEFPVGGVIKGWTEALQLMPTGSKWQLFVPADLAYGPRGTPGGPIPPNATLIFEVELVSIKEKPAAPDKAPAAAPEAKPTTSPSPAASPTPKK